MIMIFKDALKLSVYDYDIPDKVIFPTLLHEGDSATLQVLIKYECCTKFSDREI